MLILICLSFAASGQNIGYAYFNSDNFDGLKMANGEAYNKNALTAGHPSLVYGTKIKVTNTDNKKSVVVTITDRGPFNKPGGILSLSRKAGETIGMTYDNSKLSKIKAPIRIDIIGEEMPVVVEKEEAPKARTVTATSNDENTNTAKGGESTKPSTVAKAPSKPQVVAAKPKPSKPKSTTAVPTKTNTGVYKVEVQSVEKAGYGVQIGVFNDIDAVLYKVKQLTNKGFSDVYYTKSSIGYKIILKNYPTYDQANAYKKALKSKYSINGFVVEFSSL